MKTWTGKAVWLMLAALTIGALAFTATANAPVLAQDGPMEEDKGKSKAPTKDLVINFRYEGLLFCDVSVNGSKDKYNFLIDSGAAQSVLSLRVAERLGIHMEDSPVQAGGVGKQDIKLANDVIFNVNGNEFSPAVCGVLDTSHVNDKSEIKLEGILGADWMQSFKTLNFNFKTNKLTCVAKPEGEDGGMGDIMETIRKMMGGGAEGEKKDPNDFDDDGIKSDDQIFAEAYRQLIFASIQQYRLPTFARKRSAVASPFVGAKEGDDEAGPSTGIEAELAANAAARRLLDANLEASVLEFKTVEAGIGAIKMTIVPWWIVACEFNGKPCNMVFDTGASSMVVLDQNYAEDIDAGYSLSVQVSGVGTNEAGFGMVSSMKVGSVESKEEQPSISLDLSAITEQFSMLKMLGVSMKPPVGLLGLPYALRYGEMLVDNESKKISFTPLTLAEIEKVEVNPHESDELLLTAVKNVWTKKAGSAGFSGEALNPRDWPEEGFESGVVVSKIRKGTSAAKNGLEAGDLVVAIVEDPTDTSEEGQMPVADMDNLKVYAAFMGKGEKWHLLVKKKRTGATIVQEFELGNFKSSKVSAPQNFR